MSALTFEPIAGAVVVAGDVMEDIIVRPAGPMVHGSDVRAQILSMPGGSAANQAVWLGAFGVPVRFLARVGAEDVARFEARFSALAVTPVLVADAEHATGRLVTLIGEDGERSFFTDRGANTYLSFKDCPDDLLDGAGLVHISGYAYFEPAPRGMALYLAARAVDAGIDWSVDPASTGFLAEVGAEAFLGWTKGATMIFPNRDEAALLTGVTDPESQVRQLGAYYDLVVLKLGAEGAVAGGRDGIAARVPGEVIEAVDTTGAGDAFFAGFVAARRGGGSLETCLMRGNAAGAKAAAQYGGQPR